MGFEVQRDIGMWKSAKIVKETNGFWFWGLLMIESFNEVFVDFEVQMQRHMVFVLHRENGGRLVIHPHTSRTKLEAMEEVGWLVYSIPVPNELQGG